MAGPPPSPSALRVRAPPPPPVVRGFFRPPRGAPHAAGGAAGRGPRHFRAGAKLWCLRGWWGDGYERVRVIGHHRGVAHRPIEIVIDRQILTNFRAKAAYDPRLVAAIRRTGAWRDQAEVEEAARFWSTLHPPIEDLAGEAERTRAILATLTDDPVGRDLEAQAAVALAAWTQPERKIAFLPPIEVRVLADLLEARGLGLAIEQLVRLLDRRRGS